ncbi:hypothetical protein [Gilvimarinus agarilyticus]|uniref:hypothetical protein n=1 Tax=Gilvimarinus agarilyticus TaxID=679259 RepID=UPI00059EF886|nr:hypothetical protein [Gilvimarinus agarilyticus]
MVVLKGRSRAVWMLLFAVAVLGMVGCTANPVEEAEDIRARIDKKAQQALAMMLHEQPELQAEIDASEGYVVGLSDQLMLGPLSGASAVAVLFDASTGTYTYLDIDALGVGVGLGSSGTYFLAVVTSAEAMDELQRGKWLFNTSASSSFGDGGSTYQGATDDLRYYFFNKSGAAFGAGLSVTRVSVNHRLTDTGLASINVPNRGSAYANSQGPKAPRKWPHSLPLMGQEAVDAGFNLPLPFGVGVSVANVRQQMSLTELNVGFNGAEKVPYEFVAFSGAETSLQTQQIKADMWLLPFLNVYAMVGKVQGDLRMDVTLDGDTLLQNNGTDCSGIIKPPLCLVLEGREVEFPVRANVRPTTYGGGAVLAGGWRDWFAVLPVNVTYSQPNDAWAEGNSLTITPRVGRAFKSSKLGRLALFAGGNYLDSNNVVDGTFAVPGTEQVLGYRIHQANKDRWNLLLGFNWAISPVLSISAEYDGFIGTREAVISSLVVRF